MANILIVPNDIRMTVQQHVAAILVAATISTPIAHASAQAADDAAARSWLQRTFSALEANPTAAPTGAPSQIAADLATWDWLRRTPRTGQEPSLFAYSNFLQKHDDWPAVSTIRRQAESYASGTRSSDFEAKRYFDSQPPETGSGKARYALLLDGTKARDMARNAWRSPGLTREQEDALLARFGSQFRQEDDEARADALMWAGETTAASRLLPRLKDDQQTLLSARIALRTGARDADTLYWQASRLFPQHAGLTYDRAIWLERNKRLTEAEALFGKGSTDPNTLDTPVSWLRKRLTLAWNAVRRGEYQSAWRLVANHRAYTPQTDTGALSLSERILLSDSEWLAGWIALRKLNRPDEAADHFQRFLAAVNTPVSRSRGEYWLGRAKKARGHRKAAESAFRRAARYFDYYHGQLAAEELGEKPRLPRVSDTKPTNADRDRFQGSSLRAAVALLNGFDSGDREAQFIRALANSVSTAGEAQLAATFGKQIGRPDIGVWVWRNMRSNGDDSTLRTGYPHLPASVLPRSRDYILSLGIIRQESSYDPRARSHAGARGLMQLMPGTAQDTARRIGLPYSIDRLFSDPAYNVRLGTYYIGMRRDGFRNPMLAAAAYNAGAGNVNRWLLANGDPRAGVDPIDWIELIPFSETRTYVQRVIENAVVYSLLEPDAPGARDRASDWFRGP